MYIQQIWLPNLKKLHTKKKKTYNKINRKLFFGCVKKIKLNYKPIKIGFSNLFVWEDLQIFLRNKVLRKYKEGKIISSFVKACKNTHC